MPKLACRCGETLRYGEIPCSIEWVFLSDVEMDAVEEPIDSEKLYAQMKSFLKCPRCGRLWVFWNGFQAAPQEYTPA